MEGGRAFEEYGVFPGCTLTLFGFVASFAFSCSSRASKRAVGFCRSSVSHVRSHNRCLAQVTPHVVGLLLLRLLIFGLLQLLPVHLILVGELVTVSLTSMLSMLIVKIAVYFGG